MPKISWSLPNYIPPDTQNVDNKQIVLSLGLAALALGQALQNGNGSLTIRAALWLTVSILFLSYTLYFSKQPTQAFIVKIAFPLLILGLLWQIYQLATTVPGIYLLPSSLNSIRMFKSGVVMAGGMALLSLAPKNWISTFWQNVFVILTLLIILGLGIWVIKSSPEPHIDVFVIHQASAEALVQGHNPYTLAIPNIYDDIQLYGDKLANDDFLNFSNPYPPLSIYVSTLGYLVGGDIRYSHLLAIVLAGAFIAFLHARRESKLAAYIFLFTPRIFFVLEQSWTEPIVMFFLSAAIFCAIHYPRWLSITLGLFFASKQYLLFIIPLTLLIFPLQTSWRNWVKMYGWMVGVMIAVTAPLAFWSLPDFIWNVGELLWRYPFRPDSLSYLAIYNALFDQPPPQIFLIIFTVLGVLFLITWQFAPRNEMGFIISIAFCLCVFFAFNKQAFCNYYFLVIGAICCALASLTLQQEKISLIAHE